MSILTCSVPRLESNNWQAAYATSFTRVSELLTYLNLDVAQVNYKHNNFPIRVTRHFASLMEKGNTEDPLLNQIMPTAAEHDNAVGFVIDPTGDEFAEQGTGILQKYAGRALLITTGACAINCRYCFRRHFPYSDHNAASQQWAETLHQLSKMTDISEIILSGGDPLVLDNEKLTTLVEALDAIPHLKRLRIHTRLPVVLPARIDQGLLELLQNSRLTAVLVIHANHPNEISNELGRAIQLLRDQGITVFNQSVLLKNINDSAETLALLSERLFETGVIPYYLHLLDRVQGAAHFQVSITRAREIRDALLELLPGYLVPKFVIEQAGASSKLAI